MANGISSGQSGLKDSRIQGFKWFDDERYEWNLNPSKIGIPKSAIQNLKSKMEWLLHCFPFFRVISIRNWEHAPFVDISGKSFNFLLVVSN